MVLTIDTTAGSNRETDTRNHFRSMLPNGNFVGQTVAYGGMSQKRNLGWDDVDFIGTVTGRPGRPKFYLDSALRRRAYVLLAIDTHGS
jgi:hypothetical protein